MINFASGVHDQFSRAIDGGTDSFECKIPVLSLQTNRITIGAKARNLQRVPHTVSLRRHPAGFITAALESSYGMACPDPLPAVGIDPTTLHESQQLGPEIVRHAGLLVVSLPEEFKILGAEFDGSYAPIRGVDQVARDIFVAQIAGAALKNSLVSA